MRGRLNRSPFKVKEMWETKSRITLLSQDAFDLISNPKSEHHHFLFIWFSSVFFPKTWEGVVFFISPSTASPYISPLICKRFSMNWNGNKNKTFAMKEKSWGKSTDHLNFVTTLIMTAIGCCSNDYFVIAIIIIVIIIIVIRCYCHCYCCCCCHFSRWHSILKKFHRKRKEKKGKVTTHVWVCGWYHQLTLTTIYCVHNTIIINTIFEIYIYDSLL